MTSLATQWLLQTLSGTFNRYALLDSRAGASFPHDQSGSVLVITGLAFEARLVQACSGVNVLYGVGAALTDPDSPLGKRVAEAAAKASGIVSFGTAGGLDPQWLPGDCLLATEVVSHLPDASASNHVIDRAGRPLVDQFSQAPTPMVDSIYSGAPIYQTYATDQAWLQALAHLLPKAHQVSLFGAEAPVVSAKDKALLFSRSQAGAVDMESHHLARLAAVNGVPFAVCRVVIDRATETLPPAALAGMSSDGQTHILPVLASLLRQPSQLPALLRLGRDASRARQALRHIGKHIPPRFGLV